MSKRSRSSTRTNAPQTAAWLKWMLPLDGQAIHSMENGREVYLVVDDSKHVPDENQTIYQTVGDVHRLLQAGDLRRARVAARDARLSRRQFHLRTRFGRPRHQHGARDERRGHDHGRPRRLGPRSTAHAPRGHGPDEDRARVTASQAGQFDVLDPRRSRRGWNWGAVGAARRGLAGGDRSRRSGTCPGHRRKRDRRDRARRRTRASSTSTLTRTSRSSSIPTRRAPSTRASRRRSSRTAEWASHPPSARRARTSRRGQAHTASSCRGRPLREYYDRVAAAGPAINVVPMVAQGTVRMAVLGYDLGPPSAQQMDRDEGSCPRRDARWREGHVLGAALCARRLCRRQRDGRACLGSCMSSAASMRRTCAARATTASGWTRSMRPSRSVANRASEFRSRISRRWAASRGAGHRRRSRTSEMRASATRSMSPATNTRMPLRRALCTSSSHSGHRKADSTPSWVGRGTPASVNA